MTTVLVTGAAGFLGSHLTDRLLREGFEVIGIDNLITGSLTNLSEALKDPHFHFQLGDVREPLPCYAEVVFNLACTASPVHYQKDPYTTFTTSIFGAIRVIEMARERPCRVIHASTSEVYGDPQVHPQPEGYQGNVDPLGPRACYDEGKRGAETLLHNADGLDTRIVRIFNTYGPRMSVDDGRVVSSFIVQALKEKPLTVFGEGTQTRAFCYVDDMIDGLMGVMRLDSLDGVLNLGDPWEMEIRWLASLIVELTGSESDVVHAPLPKGDPKQRCPDIEKAKKLIGFSPKTQLRDGLRLTIDDLRERL